MALSVSAAINLAASFMLSMSFNPRRTEDGGHPLWSMFLAKVCGELHGRLIITPQYRLYTSRKDLLSSFISDSADPDGTTPDSDIEEVIPDFVVMLYQAKVHNARFKVLLRVLSMLKLDFLPYNHVQISACFLPIVLELKRPITRHSPDLDHYAQSLRNVWGAAYKQATSQVHCLYCTPKFCRQEKVLAIAAAGDWWSFRLFRRAEFRNSPFILSKYKLNAEASNLIENRIHQDDDLLTAGGEEETELMAPSALREMEAYLVNPPPSIKMQIDKVRHDMDEQRSQRQAKRRHMKEHTKRAYDTWQKFLQDLPSPESTSSGQAFFTDDQLNKYAVLRSKWDQEWELNGASGMIASADAFTTPNAEWSKLMRVGTPASRLAEEYVQKYLQDFVKEYPLE